MARLRVSTASHPQTVPRDGSNLRITHFEFGLQSMPRRGLKLVLSDAVASVGGGAEAHGNDPAQRFEA